MFDHLIESTGHEPTRIVSLSLPYHIVENFRVLPKFWEDQSKALKEMLAIGMEQQLRFNQPVPIPEGPIWAGATSLRLPGKLLDLIDATEVPGAGKQAAKIRAWICMGWNQSLKVNPKFAALELHTV